MKPLMLLAITVLAAIVIVTSFDLQMAPVAALQIPDNLAGNVLYVCPPASSGWDNAAQAIAPFTRYITIAFFFALIILMFMWGWALYQNLLKDEWKQDAYTNPWKFTKFLFWAAVVVIIVSMTPNHFRTVHIDGAPGQWVLCENNTPGARAVRADAVH